MALGGFWKSDYGQGKSTTQVYEYKGDVRTDGVLGLVAARFGPKSLCEGKTGSIGRIACRRADIVLTSLLGQFKRGYRGVAHPIAPTVRGGENQGLCVG